MESEYKKEEWAALEEKIMHPEKKVICPRCGKELNAKVAGNSMQVKCKTANCLVETIRGI